MEYRKLGDTGIEVSEIAFGAEFLVERPYEDTEVLIKACEANGINFVDCWMSAHTWEGPSSQTVKTG